MIEAEDIPSTADWRERIARTVEENERRKIRERSKVVRTSKPRKAQVTIDAHPPFWMLLNKACEARGIGRAGYIRRAVARQIARDLGVDWLEPLRYCARPRQWGVFAGGEPGKWSKVAEIDDGSGFGDWSN